MSRYRATVDRVKAETLVERISASRISIAAAADHLSGVLSEVRRSPRAEKKTISRALDEAIKALRAAKSELQRLERLAASNVDD